MAASLSNNEDLWNAYVDACLQRATQLTCQWRGLNFYVDAFDTVSAAHVAIVQNAARENGGPATVTMLSEARVMKHHYEGASSAKLILFEDARLMHVRVGNDMVYLNTAPRDHKRLLKYAVENNAVYDMRMVTALAAPHKKDFDNVAVLRS